MIDCLAQLLPGQLPSPAAEGVDASYEPTWPWPPWIALVILALAIGLVVVLYRREAKNLDRRWRLLLASLRSSLVLLLVFMLYGWMQHRHRTDLPDLAIVLDRSESMAVEDRFDGVESRRRAERRTQAAGFASPNRLNLARALLVDERFGWLQDLAKEYRIKLYSIGDATERIPVSDQSWKAMLAGLQPTQPASRLGDGLQDVFAAQRGRPTAAMILLSDGVTTGGRSLTEVAELARRKAIPVFTVGLGDQQPVRDTRLRDLVVEPVVFVDDVVHFDFQILSQGYADQETTVRLKEIGSETALDEKTVRLPSDGEAQAIRLSYRPQREGTLEHVLEIEPIEGEINRENNRLSAQVQVRDAPIRVLFVQAYPSYEYRFLKNLLERAVHRSDSTPTKAVELTTILQEADLEHAEQDASTETVFPVGRDELFSFDVVIFGDVNPAFLSPSVLENLAAFVRERGGGLAVLAGPRYTPSAYEGTPLEDLLPFVVSTARTPDPQAVLTTQIHVEPTAIGLESPPMQIGDSTGDTAQAWKRLPGLYWQLATPDIRPAARVLAVSSQTPDEGMTGLPLICLQFVGAGKVVFHATDETYRWSRVLGSELYYARYWMQMLRYLSRSKLLSDELPTKLEANRHEYQLGEVVELRVQFRDNSVVPEADDGVTVVVELQDGRRRRVSLLRQSTSQGRFSGSVSGLEVGSYRVWLATPPVDPAPSPCEFVVLPPAGEQARLEMNAEVLRQVANRSRGRYYTWDNVDRLPIELPAGRQVRVESLPPDPLWNSPQIVALFLTLLTCEWLVRKRQGLL